MHDIIECTILDHKDFLAFAAFLGSFRQLGHLQLPCSSEAAVHEPMHPAATKPSESSIPSLSCLFITQFHFTLFLILQ